MKETVTADAKAAACEKGAQFWQQSSEQDADCHHSLWSRFVRAAMNQASIRAMVQVRHYSTASPTIQSYFKRPITPQRGKLQLLVMFTMRHPATLKPRETPILTKYKCAGTWNSAAQLRVHAPHSCPDGRFSHCKRPDASREPVFAHSFWISSARFRHCLSYCRPGDVLGSGAPTLAHTEVPRQMLRKNDKLSNSHAALCRSCSCRCFSV